MAEDQQEGVIKTKEQGVFLACGFGSCIWSSGQIKELCGLHLAKRVT